MTRVQSKRPSDIAGRHMGVTNCQRMSQGEIVLMKPCLTSSHGFLFSPTGFSFISHFSEDFGFSFCTESSGVHMSWGFIAG